jgi:hypothetical protein
MFTIGDGAGVTRGLYPSICFRHYGCTRNPKTRKAEGIDKAWQWLRKSIVPIAEPQLILTLEK